MTEQAIGSVMEVTVEAHARDCHPLEVASGSLLAVMLECSAEHRSRAEALARVRGARRLKAFAESLEQAALLDLAGTAEQLQVHELGGRFVPVHDEAVAEVALATAQSEAAVRRQLATARTLQSFLPETQQALADGRIDASKAAMLAHAASRVPEYVRAQMEEALLEPAQSLHARDFHVAAEQAIRCLDPDGAELRRARAVRRRAVWVRPDEDGNAVLSARLASADAHLCMRSLEDHVRSSRESIEAAHDIAGVERPTLGMLHAEELVERILGAAGSADGVHAPLRPVRVEVQVQVDLATLAGLQDDPVTLDGLAVSDMTELRTWLADCNDVRFRRLITDPETRAVVDCGSSTYTAPVALRRFIVARDGRCIWPGCAQSAVDCDLDHALPWGAGGATDRDNLNALCRSHHVLKTLYRYALVKDANDQWVLVTPAGEMLPTGNHPPSG